MSNHNSSHHHHHRKDETGEFRKQMERSVRMRRTLPRLLFTTGCIIAGLIMLAVVAVYLLDR